MMKLDVHDEGDWRKLQGLVIAQFRLDPARSPHAPDHWWRVERYGMALSGKSGADPLVVRLFALLHDCRRLSDGVEPEHGPRAAEFARELCGTLIDLQAGQLELLARACQLHTAGEVSRNPTIGSCWDADRLDLDRIAMTVDPEYISTEYGRVLAAMRPADRQKLAGKGLFTRRV